jgi:hypothetical protein
LTKTTATGGHDTTTTTTTANDQRLMMATTRTNDDDDDDDDALTTTTTVRAMTNEDRNPKTNPPRFDPTQGSHFLFVGTLQASNIDPFRDV